MLIGNSLQTFVFAIMNKRKEKQRVANGKPAKLVDTSMHKAYAAAPNDAIGEYRLGDQAFMDLTDVQNDEVSSPFTARANGALTSAPSLSTRTERARSRRRTRQLSSKSVLDG